MESREVWRTGNRPSFIRFGAGSSMSQLKLERSPIDHCSMYRTALHNTAASSCCQLGTVRKMSCNVGILHRGCKVVVINAVAGRKKLEVKADIIYRIHG